MRLIVARLQRGNILLKQGSAQEAREDFEAVLLGNPGNEEARSQLALTGELERLSEDAQAAYRQRDYQGTVTVMERVIEVRVCVRQTDRQTDYQGTVAVMERVIELSPWDPDARELRAACFIELGEPRKAIQDLNPTTKLRNDNRAAFLQLSRLHYSLGEHPDSLSWIRTQEGQRALQDHGWRILPWTVQNHCC
ncbi:UNVERIFIED_CONTAM: hypothetical protein FKN15_020960 [Acipenser sinensis]